MSKIFISITLTILCNALGSLYAMEMNIWKACDSGNTKQVKLFIEQDGTLVNARDIEKLTPLHYATLNGHAETAALLLQHNAEVDARDLSNWTPLHYTSRWDYTEIVALLLQHEADVNAQDDYRWAPLYCTTLNDHTKTMKFLLSHGATPHKPINLFKQFAQYSQIYAPGYESWIYKTFVSRNTIMSLLRLVGKQIKVPLPEEINEMIVNFALADEVQEWEQFKKNNPNIAALARIELP